MLTPYGYQLLHTRLPSRHAHQLDRSHEQHRGDAGRAVLCARCAARISDSSQRIRVAGAHEHTFFNPAGLVFQVQCFAAAPGCTGVGALSAEFSWFAGYQWQIAICGACHQHLGWHFSGDASFSALIARQIREADT